MSEAWSIIASSLRFPVCGGHTASACLVSFWFFFYNFFIHLLFVGDRSSFIAGGKGGGGREDFCVTITFTLRLCNFLLTPLPPTPPPSHWHLIGSQYLISPPLYYVNDHPPPPENNVISPLKSSKPLPSPTPTGDKQGLTGTSRGIFLADENGFITRMKVTLSRYLLGSQMFELNYSK